SGTHISDDVLSAVIRHGAAVTEIVKATAIVLAADDANQHTVDGTLILIDDPSRDFPIQPDPQIYAGQFLARGDIHRGDDQFRPDSFAAKPDFKRTRLDARNFVVSVVVRADVAFHRKISDTLTRVGVEKPATHRAGGCARLRQQNLERE